jgi:hypothetical protein
MRENPELSCESFLKASRQEGMRLSLRMAKFK